MIKNQKQVKITEERLSELKDAKKQFLENKNMNELELNLGLNSFDALISDLESQLAEYKSLIEGNFHCLRSKSLEDIPNVLIAARLAQRISQKELAEMLEKKEQQIQRYEITDYETASWPRIVEVATALNLKISFDQILIINSENNDNDFTYPEGVTQDQIDEVNWKIKKNNSLILL